MSTKKQINTSEVTTQEVTKLVFGHKALETKIREVIATGNVKTGAIRYPLQVVDKKPDISGNTLIGLAAVELNAIIMDKEYPTEKLIDQIGLIVDLLLGNGGMGSAKLWQIALGLDTKGIKASAEEIAATMDKSPETEGEFFTFRRNANKKRASMKAYIDSRKASANLEDMTPVKVDQYLIDILNLFGVEFRRI